MEIISVKRLPKYLKLLREKSKLSMRDVFLETGVTKSHIHFIEHGKTRPRPDTLNRFVWVYGLEASLCYDVDGELIPDNEMAGKLREWRAKSGLSLSAVGNILDVHESTVSLWESGKRAPKEVDVYKQFSKLYKVKIKPIYVFKEVSKNGSS